MPPSPRCFVFHAPRPGQSALPGDRRLCFGKKRRKEARSPVKIAHAQTLPGPGMYGLRRCYGPLFLSRRALEKGDHNMGTPWPMPRAARSSGLWARPGRFVHVEGSPTSCSNQSPSQAAPLGFEAARAACVSTWLGEPNANVSKSVGPLVK